jgi:hypothetical protein
VVTTVETAHSLATIYGRGAVGVEMLIRHLRCEQVLAGPHPGSQELLPAWRGEYRLNPYSEEITE